MSLDAVGAILIVVGVSVLLCGVVLQGRHVLAASRRFSETGDRAPRPPMTSALIAAAGLVICAAGLVVRTSAG